MLPYIMAHIEILNNQDCCGCSACASVCPIDCIVMTPSVEGFLYPEIDTDRCTECGLCTETCPWLNQPEIYERIFPPQVYAAWHLNDEIRRQSSSGGVFTALADEILARGGAVVGAAFGENMVVRHVLVEDTDNLARLQGSKYVQSEIAPELFLRVRTLLTQGRHLLFTGTPCQVAALRSYLRKDYKTLLCCDLICHGVPSPGWFQKYISDLSKGKRAITSFDFRYKENGWKQFRVRKTWNDGSSKVDTLNRDPFMDSFLKNYSLRESCYSCKFTTTTRMGDITLADYWKVSTKYPEYDRDDKGTSLLLINSKKGQAWITHCQNNLFLGEGDLDHAIAGNHMLTRPAVKPPERETFFLDMSGLTVHELRKKYQLHPRPFWRRVFGFVQRRLKLKSSF